MVWPSEVCDVVGMEAGWRTKIDGAIRGNGQWEMMTVADPWSWGGSGSVAWHSRLLVGPRVLPNFFSSLLNPSSVVWLVAALRQLDGNNPQNCDREYFHVSVLGLHQEALELWPEFLPLPR